MTSSQVDSIKVSKKRTESEASLNDVVESYQEEKRRKISAISPTKFIENIRAALPAMHQTEGMEKAEVEQDRARLAKLIEKLDAWCAKFPIVAEQNQFTYYVEQNVVDFSWEEWMYTLQNNGASSKFERFLDHFVSPYWDEEFHDACDDADAYWDRCFAVLQILMSRFTINDLLKAVIKEEKNGQYADSIRGGYGDWPLFDIMMSCLALQLDSWTRPRDANGCNVGANDYNEEGDEEEAEDDDDDDDDEEEEANGKETANVKYPNKNCSCTEQHPSNYTHCETQ